MAWRSATAFLSVLGCAAAPDAATAAPPTQAAASVAPAVQVSLGGDVRSRAEVSDAPGFGLSDRADSYLLQRILVHGDVRLGDSIRVFAEAGDHEAIGKKRIVPTDEDSFDLQQLFIDVKAADNLSIRVGRQELSFSPSQRFVSVRDTANIRQAFDGARISLSRRRLRLDLFAVRPLLLEPGALDDGSNDDVLFAGGYAAYRTGEAATAPTIDGYLFRLSRRNLTVGGRRGTERRYSVGARIAGAEDGLDWDAEAMLQFGDFAGQRIRAGGVFVDVGRSFGDLPAQPRLGLRFDWGSGDRNPADRTVGSFHPLFPKGAYFNEAGLASFTNLVAVRASAKARLTHKLTSELAVQAKARATTDDAVYLQPSSPLKATYANRAREIGQAYSLDITYQANRMLTLRGYLLRHTAGDALRLAGGHPVSFAMTSASFKF